MVTKSESLGRPASSGWALISTYLEYASEAVVAVDESQKIVVFSRGAE